LQVQVLQSLSSGSPALDASLSQEEYLTDCELLRVRVEELTTEVTKARQ
jgi:hypothetical protein